MIVSVAGLSGSSPSGQGTGQFDRFPDPGGWSHRPVTPAARAIAGGNGFRNGCSTTFSGITQHSVASTECRLSGSLIWCCLHAPSALLVDTC